VYDAVWKHAGEDTGVEICGVLVGRYVRDDTGPFVLVDGSIRGEKATSKFAEVTFTHETWSKIHEQMDSKFSDRVIVGWYHSHPDFGIFLSDRDRFIQEHFFSSPGQVAYVVDPIRKTEGVFIWRKGKVALTEHYWIGGRVQVPTASGEEKPAKGPAAALSTGGAAAPGDQPPEAPWWLHAVTNGLFYLCIFILGLLVASFFNRQMLQSDRQRIVNDTLAHAFWAMNIRPGLNLDMTQVEKNLDDFRQKYGDLARKHQELAGNDAEIRKRYEEVEQSWKNHVLQIQLIKNTYCMTDEEMAHFERWASGKLKGGGLRLRLDPKAQDNAQEPPKSKDEPKAKEEAKPRDDKTAIGK
jgi:proteasome lid subunit RPN8/RPN11